MSLLQRKQLRGTDNLSTPAEAVKYLLPYVKKEWTIFEPACGEGKLADELRKNGNQVIATDISKGDNFLTNSIQSLLLKRFDCVITNPPYRHKTQFLERCYEIGIPFALLMPITALEGKERQELYRKYGLEVIFLPKRIDFTGKKAPWFAVAWFTWGLKIGRELTFSEDSLFTSNK